MRIVNDDGKALLRGRVIAVLNMGSGGNHDEAPARMRQIFDDGGLTKAEVVAVTADGLNRALDDAVRGGDAIVVLGGDGTIRCAAARCGEAGKPLIALPGGTMNMLPRALLGDRGWEQALVDTLADPVVHKVSGGRAEGELFFCAAILGAPTLWADARESLRHADLAGAAKRTATAIRGGRSGLLAYQFGDAAEGEAEAVAVICPLVSRALAEDEPGLEVAAIDPQTAASLFRLAFHAVFDDWRIDPSVHLAKVRTARVTGHGRVPVILDGEKARLKRTVQVSFVPHAFSAVVPADPAGGGVQSL
jgi:diacylglycerol kinase family enzyme